MTKSANIAANRPTARDARVPLKLILRDIAETNPKLPIVNRKGGDKAVRVWLRANMSDVHERNAAWTFDAKQYDKVRAQFDPAYAAAIAPAPRAPRKSKAKVEEVTASAPAE